MKNKKFILVIAILLIVVMSVSLVGCNKKLDTSMALEDLKIAIEASRNADNYYTSYNDKTTPYTYKLNVANANDSDNMVMQFSEEHDITTTVTYTHLYYQNGQLLYSNPDYQKKDKKDETPMEKKNYEYWSKTIDKAGLFTTDFVIKGTKYDSAGNAVYENGNKVLEDDTINLSRYTDDALIALLTALTSDNTEVLSYTKNNRVRNITVKITGDHPLSSYEQINIRMINEKIYQIADTKDSFVFDITYVGPHIFFPNADTVIEE